ncbi:fructose bisphosphate aldolase [Pectinatus brassicae]|uniref:fructose-bisphosphate aldolase n=1 Tax=Pectinatus brassicae TaxID=862415 RepID=A0A840UM60_9FIRM|nr:fructose bisphosphate aldolase [Pectinatus brassicae]MBB5337290.1 fructose-bisphosphate aldolase class I [Pectinatus brassicae]
MDQDKLQRICKDKGFIAALDQSGGSTPKALAVYGIKENEYNGNDEMFAKVHAMRTRIIKSPAFNSKYILGAILFENTMDRTVDGELTADYLWNKKQILSFLKVDKGLAELEDGVQCMKPIPQLDDLLKRALKRNIFGTKMRSVIKKFNPIGIKKIVKQQFEIGKQIAAAGLVPIIEPEIDINSKNRAESERVLKEEMLKELALLSKDEKIMLKLTIPEVDDFYSDLINAQHNIIRVVALSGGFSRDVANEKLARNKGLIASFSRALAEGLSVQQSDEEFNAVLSDSIKQIYTASIT